MFSDGLLRLSLPQRTCHIHRGFAMNVPLELIYDITGVRKPTNFKPLIVMFQTPPFRPGKLQSCQEY